MMTEALTRIRSELADSIATKTRLLADEALLARLVTLADRIIEAQRAGKKLVIFGNGGSAADSQHISAELIGRFEKERKALRALALTTNTSILTALANDYDYNYVFARQIEAWVEPGDVVIGITTSGNSKNVLRGFEAAKQRGAVVAAFTGEGGGASAALADLLFAMPSKNTARIQECHIAISHILCGLVERAFVDG